jgi:hypothetical protein
MRASLQRYEASQETTPKDLIQSLEMFKEKTKWRDFSKFFTTFMQHMKGQCYFSLSYILRDNKTDEEINIADYETDDAYKEAIVPFSGPHFDLDNSIVFDSLKSYALGGPHWTWIRDIERRRDGKGAWLALEDHFEGPRNQICLKAIVYATMRRATLQRCKEFQL